MTLLAGTSKGVFSVVAGDARQVLESRGVRDLVSADGAVFAGTGAGLYRSRDDGESWQTSGLEEFEVWQVRAAADGTLLAGTQPAGLFRSEDQGESWAPVTGFDDAPGASDWCIPVDPPLPGRARTLVIDPRDPRRIRVGVEVGGVLSSEDGGRSWALTLPGNNPDLHVMVAHPERPDELYASTGYGRLDGVAEMVEGNAGMFRSTDGGNTWKYIWHGITPRYSRPLVIDPRAPYPITVGAAPTAFSSYREEGGARAMLFRTDDGGDTWRSLCDDAHCPSAANFHGLAPDPAEAGSVLVGTDTGEVWRVDAAASWTLLGAGMPAVLALLA